MNPVLIHANTTPGKIGYMPNLWWTPIYYQLFHMDWCSITKGVRGLPLVHNNHVYGCSDGVIYVGTNFHLYRIIHDRLVRPKILTSRFYALNHTVIPIADPETGIWMCYDDVHNNLKPVLLEPVTKAQLLMESLWT